MLIILSILISVLIIILGIFSYIYFNLYKKAKNQECTIYDMRTFLQDFINHLNIPIFIKNQPSQWFLVNEAYIKFTQRDHSMDNTTGKFTETDEYVFQNFEPIQTLNQYYDTLGQFRNVITELYPLVDNDDQRYIVGVIRDLDLEYSLAKHKRDKQRKKILQKRLNRKIRELNTVLNSQIDLIQKSELDGTLTYANKKYLDTFGLNKEDVTNRKINYYDLVHPDDLDQTKEIQQDFFYNAPHRGKVIQRAKTVDGYRWFEWEGVVVYDKDGNMISHIGTGRDITDRIEAEQHNRLTQLENELLVRLLHEHGSLTYYLDEIVKMIELFDPNTIGSILIHDNGILYNFSSHQLPRDYVELLENGFPVMSDGGSCGTAAYYKSSCYIDDIATHPNWTKFPDVQEKALKAGICACFSEPILGRDNQLLGTIAIYYKDDSYENQIYQHLLKHSARLAAIVIDRHETEQQRKRYEEELQLRERRFRELLYNIQTIAIQGCTFDNIIRFWNKGSENFYQYSPDEVLGSDITELLPVCNKQESLKEILERVKEKGHISPHEIDLKRKDGSVINVLTSYGFTTNIDYENEFFCFDIDLTSHKLLEHELECSNASYKSLIENLSECIIQLDLEFNIVYCSPQIEKMVGKTTDQLLGLNFEDIFLIHNHDIMDAIENHSSVFGIQITTDDANHNFITLEFDLYSIFDNDNNLLAYQGTIRDITDQKRLESALIQTSNMFKDVAGVLPIGLIIIDRNGRILYRNTHTYQYNISIEDSNILDTEKLGINVERKYDAFFVVEKKLDDIWFEIIVRDIMYEMVEAKLIVLNDIHSKKIKSIELENEVNKRVKQFQIANKELESFAYAVSHDLRTPLRHINGFVDALNDEYYDSFDDTGKEYLEYLKQSSQRMHSLINGILTLSRSTRGELNITKDVDLTSLIPQLINTLNIPSSENIISIHPNLIANCDKNMITSVFMNLIDNAYKFSSDNELICIEIGSIIYRNTQVYFICDNGVGFDDKIGDKLFDIFQTGKHSQSRQGIGLATVQRIILKHGGIIWLESEENNGCAVYFTLGDVLGDV